MSTQRTLVLAVLLVARAVIAQPQSEFVPVTDRVLQNPDPADWLMWRRTLDTWGFSPLTEVNRKNVGALRMVWTRALGPGIQEGTPLVTRRDVLPQSERLDPGDQRGERRSALGIPAHACPRTSTKYFPVPSINRNLAIFGRLRSSTRARGRLRVRARRAQRPAQWETSSFDYHARRLSKRRARSSRTARSSPGAAASREGESGRVRDRRARREDGEGALAHAHDPRPRGGERQDHGATCRMMSAGTSARGWCRATIPS